MSQENWNIAESITEELRRRDAWAGHHLFTVEDWQQEVAERDTHLGYHEWLTCKIGNGLDDEDVTAEEVALGPATEPGAAGISITLSDGNIEIVHCEGGTLAKYRNVRPGTWGLLFDLIKSTLTEAAQEAP